MAHRGRCLAEQGWLFALARHGWAALLVLLPGCRVPAARFAPAESCCPFQARSLALSHQVVLDSSLELVHHPLQSTWSLLYEAGDQTQAVTRGALAKRFLLPLRGPPG